MNLIRKCLLTFIILGLIYDGYGQEKSETAVKNQFTLEEAVQYAIQNGYDVKLKGIDLAVAKKKIWETTAIGLPQVSAAVAYTHNFQQPIMAFGNTTVTKDSVPALPGENKYIKGIPIAGDKFYVNTYRQDVKLAVEDNTTWDINVSQLIFSGEYIVGLRAAKVFREMSEQNLAKSLTDIRESVSTSYYLAMVMDENVKILKETQQVTDANLKDLIAMGEQGLVEETGVDQVRIIKSNIDNAVQSLQRAAIVSKNLLKFQMGLPIESEILLSDKLEKYTNETFFLPYLGEKFDATNTIDYQILETGVKLQKLSYDREKTTYLPSIAGFYRHHEQLKEAGLNFMVKDMAGINISVPIFSSGMRNAKVQEAKLNLDKMKVTQQQATEGLNLQYQNTFNDFQTNFASFITNKQNMQLAKKIFDQTMVKYKEGVSSAMDLNTSQNQYLTTQRDYFSALNNLLSAKVKLDKLLSKNLQQNNLK